MAFTNHVAWGKKNIILTEIVVHLRAKVEILAD